MVSMDIAVSSPRYARQGRVRVIRRVVDRYVTRIHYIGRTMKEVKIRWLLWRLAEAFAPLLGLLLGAPETTLRLTRATATMMAIDAERPLRDSRYLCSLLDVDCYFFLARTICVHARPRSTEGIRHP